MVAPLLAGICKSAIIARHLGPSRMGVYSYAMWIAVALSAVASLGLPTAVTKYASEFLGRGDHPQAARLTRQLVKLQLKVVLAVALLAEFATFLLAQGSERLVLVLTTSMVVPIVVTRVLGSVLEGHQQYQKLALIDLKSSLADVGLVGLGAVFTRSVEGILLALIAGSLIATYLTYHAVRPMLTEGPLAAGAPDDPKVLKRALNFAFTESYILFTDAIIWQKSEVFFLKMLSALREVAFYGIAFGLSARLMTISSSFTQTLMPLSSESFGRSGLRELGRIYEMSVKYTQMALLPLCAIAIGIATPLINLVYGPAYQPLVPALRVLLASLALTCLAYVGASVLYATEKQGFIAKCQTPIAALNIALDLILIRTHGAIGAAIANSCAQVLEAVILLAYARRVVAGRFPWRPTAKIYATVALAALPLVLAQHVEVGPWSAAGLAGVGLCIYIAILVAWGELGSRELRVLNEVIGQPVRLWLGRSAGAGGPE
jgi:O-antigen/teichoic acid export membrane protein